MAVRAKLKIMRGSNAGKILEINVPQYIIGRTPGCNLRPQSDAISRQHCALITSDSGLSIRDLKSRNGTILNGEKIESEKPLANGDELQIGPLFFQVILHVEEKKGAPVAPVAIAPAETPRPAEVDEESVLETTSSSSTAGLPSDSGLIGDWLMADLAQEPKATANKETRQFKLDETANVPLVANSDKEEPKSKGNDKDKKGKKDKEYGKLPKPPQESAGTSRDAAADTLKKMYNRGT